MLRKMPINPLQSSPTAGEDSEHSAYYRRLLSAGYKGHIQGGIGGATLYGSFGLIIGGLVGIAFAPVTGFQSLWLIPALGGLGAVEGARTFADIGSHAAIMADSAETNEKRRMLLSQLDVATDPQEKEKLNQELSNLLESKPMHKLFHWKAVLFGAVLGGAIAALAVTFAPHALLLAEITEGLGMGGIALGSSFAVLAGTAIGALAGATIGVDREYVRRWLDTSESLVNDRATPKSYVQSVARAITPGTHMSDVQANQQQKPLPELAPAPNASEAPNMILPHAPLKSVATVEPQGRVVTPELQVAAG